MVVKRKTLYLLPSFFTLANMAFGFYAIIAAIHGKWLVSGVVLTIAVLMDGLDGRVARYTHTTSAFGLNFDSLVDVISFGLAPAIIVYIKWIKINPEYQQFGWLLCFMYLAAGAIRLARFNVLAADESSHSKFKGLPIPAAAMLISTSLWLVERHGVTYPVIQTLVTKAMPVMLIVLTYLMVSRIRYPNFKSIPIIGKNIFVSSILIISTLMLLVFYQAILCFLIAIFYVLSGIVSEILKHHKKKDKNNITHINEDFKN